VADLDLEGDLSTWYDETIGIENTSLIEGSYYHYVVKSTTSHVFYLDNYWIDGSIIFKNQEYKTSMMYDIFSDILLIQNTTSFKTRNEPLKLPQNQIESFKMKGDHFKFLVQNEAPAKPGFYEVLFEGKRVELYAKRIKNEKIRDNLTYFFVNDVFYLIFDGVAHKIKGRRSFIKVLPEMKTDIKQYAKRKKLFKLVGIDEDLILMSRYLELKLSTQ
jgi:hypothetical protein